MARKPTLIDDYFSEHVHMPGFPQIVVTRGFLYAFLRDAGYDPKERGFGSIDYMIGAARVSQEPLTNEVGRDRLLELFKEQVRR